MPVTPISPNNIAQAKATVLPDLVIKTWNTLIAESFSGNKALILQKDAIRALKRELVVDESDVYNNKWLDIEALYEQAGWNVKYDAPAYNETYQASFTFSPKG